MSPKTVESHVRAIFMKLDLAESADEHRRVAAVVRWLQIERGRDLEFGRLRIVGVAAVFVLFAAVGGVILYLQYASRGSGECERWPRSRNARDSPSPPTTWSGSSTCRSSCSPRVTAGRSSS